MNFVQIIWRKRKGKIRVLLPFQEYFTYIEPIVNQRWMQIGVLGEKPPDLAVQNLASHRGERSNV